MVQTNDHLMIKDPIKMRILILGIQIFPLQKKVDEVGKIGESRCFENGSSQKQG